MSREKDDEVIKIENIEAVFFTNEEDKGFHTYTVESAEIVSTYRKIDKYCEYKEVNLYMTYKWGSPGLDGLKDICSYNKGSMKIVAGNDVIEIYNVELKEELDGGIVFKVNGDCGVCTHRVDRDFNKYPSMLKEKYDKVIKELEDKAINKLGISEEDFNKMTPKELYKQLKEYEDIKIRKISRAEHISNLLLDTDLQSEDYDITLRGIVDSALELNKLLPGGKVLYEVKLGSKTMAYSENFVEDVLKKEFVKYFKEEENLIEVRDQFGNVKYIKK